MITNPIDLYIARKLKEIRIKAGFSQSQVGELIGVTHQQFQKYEAGTNRIAASRLYEFSQLFNKPIITFFDQYISDGEYHNFEFKSEIERKGTDKKRDRDAQRLLKYFNQIKDDRLKSRIIALVREIGVD